MEPSRSKLPEAVPWTTYSFAATAGAAAAAAAVVVVVPGLERLI